MSKIYLKSSFSKFLLMLLIVAFILSSISGVLFMTSKYNIIKIEDEKININEFIRVVNNEKQIEYLKNPNEKTINFINSKEFLLLTIRKVLNSRLIDNEIKYFKLKKPEDLIISKIVKEPFFFTNGKFDNKKFQDALKNVNLTENQYIEEAQKQESINFLFSSFLNSIKINEVYVDSIFKIVNTYKNVKIFRVQKNNIPVKLERVSDEEIDKYYNNNIGKFTVPEERKVDYIKIENYNDLDIQKLEELLLISNNLNEIAKEFNTKVKSYGYINRYNLANKNVENITNIDVIFNFEVNDFSNIEKIDKNIFVFSVADIKKEYIKTKDESKNDIVNFINEENKEKQYIKFVESNIDKIKNNAVDINKLNGFKVSDIDIRRNMKNFNERFINEILLNKDKYLTKVYEDGNSLYFGYINSTKKLYDGDKDFVSKDVMEERAYENMARSIEQNYINYLETIKYDVKINYKLLDLIK